MELSGLTDEIQEEARREWSWASEESGEWMGWDEMGWDEMGWDEMG
jgi:hypothetical protein